jgi:hypothetical protein
MKQNLIDFLKYIDEENLVIKPSTYEDVAVGYLESLNSEHQSEAPNVMENEQKEKICALESCAHLGTSRYKMCLECSFFVKQI